MRTPRSPKGRAAVAGLTAAVLCAAPGAASAAGGGSGHRPAFKVTSTLPGGTALPHRIHWVAKPSISSSNITRVVFLIDGKVRWVEHHTPYAYYGVGSNYLVTTWLAPGIHRFSVRATAKDGRRATSPTVTARVLPARDPPAELASGVWKHTISPPIAPAGVWTLSIDKVGWKIADPLGGGNLIDVAYLAPGLLESRSGIRFTPNPGPNVMEGNGWCDEPFRSDRYGWSIQGDTLTLTPVGPARCGGQHQIWAGDWTRG